MTAVSVQSRLLFKKTAIKNTVQIVNTPIFVGPLYDRGWCAWTPQESCEPDFTIFVYVKTRAEAFTAAERYLEEKFP